MILHIKKNLIFHFFKYLCIDIQKIRDQTYDNATTMSGKYSGLQARFKKHNAIATYIQYSSRSKNLIGSSAGESCSGSLCYLYFIQCDCSYFFAYTCRCMPNMPIYILVHISKHIKRINYTRLFARANAVAAFRIKYKVIEQVAFENSEK